MPFAGRFSFGAAVWLVCLLGMFAAADRVLADDAPKGKEKLFRLTGTVVNEEKQPLVGAAVIVKGTQRGSIAEKGGKFTLMVKASDVISVSMLGYKAAEVTVGSRTSLTVVLEEATRKIDDVVVIGYGEQNRKDVTGTIGTVDVGDLTKAPVPSFDQALQGRIAGVMITSNDGQPGSDMNIVVRGANSVSQDNSPLYVIDGFPTEDFSAASINPQDIASISILKDASSTAIYGSRGANGVVIIETKSGKTGPVKVSYTGTYGVQQVAKTMDVMNPYDYVSYMLELNPNLSETFLTNVNMTLEDYRNEAMIDWQDKLFRIAPMHTHSVSVSGGTQQTRYWASGNIVDQKGIIDHSGYTRYQGQVRIDQALSKKLRLDLNAAYMTDVTRGAVASEESNSGPQSTQYQSYMMYRVWSYRPFLLGDTTYDQMYEDESSLSNLNPIMSNANEVRNVTRRNLRVNARLTYKILPELTLNIRGGIYENSRETERFYNSKTYSGYPSANNSRGVNGSYGMYRNKQLLNENTLTYQTRFRRDHFISALAGFTMQTYNLKDNSHEVWNIPFEEFGLAGLDTGTPHSTNAVIEENRLMSALARVNYSYKSRYILTASFRADGSSKFAKGKRWGYFPSGAVAWRMKDEKFLRNVKFVDEAKLRFSWGVTGNNRVGNYASYGGIKVNEYYSQNNETPQNAAVISSLANPNLTWESTEQFDLGYDLTMFKERLALTVDLYRKTSDHLLLNSDLPYSMGLTKAYRNIGKVRNDGLEISLNTVNVKTRNFTWSSSFNISFNRSKVLQLTDGQQMLFSKIVFTGDFNNTNLYVTKVGGPITAFYGLVYDGVYQLSDFDVQRDGSYLLKPSLPTNGSARANIRPGDAKFVDQNGDGTITAADNAVIGRALPLHTGGFNNTFVYKNLSLNVFFQWNYGNKVMNANRIVLEGNYQNVAINQYASYAGRWSMENQGSNIPRAKGHGPTGYYTSRTLEDGSFLRLKTLQLAYSLPKKFVKKLGMRSINVNFACQNLFTWTNYSGVDPEVSTRNTTLTPGFDYSAYARNRIYTFGLQLDF